MTDKFGGMGNCGKIFDIMPGLVGLGGALGAVAAGAVCDHFSNCRPLLILGVVTNLVCGARLFRLGSGRMWRPDHGPLPAAPSDQMPEPSR